jgi:hypothetical protein
LPFTAIDFQACVPDPVVSSRSRVDRLIHDMENGAPHGREQEWSRPLHKRLTHILPASTGDFVAAFSRPSGICERHDRRSGSAGEILRDRGLELVPENVADHARSRFRLVRPLVRRVNVRLQAACRVPDAPRGRAAKCGKRRSIRILATPIPNRGDFSYHLIVPNSAGELILS